MFTVKGVFAGTARQYWSHEMLCATRDRSVPFGSQVTLLASLRCCRIHAW